MKWKNILGQIFGGASASSDMSARIIGRASNDNQNDAVSARSLSVAELDSVIACLRDLKDITQTNMLALSSLVKATPKDLGAQDAAVEKAARDLCAMMQPMADVPYVQTRDMLGNYVCWANQLTAMRANFVKIERVQKPNMDLPVNETECAMLRAIAQAAQGAYKQMIASQKQIVCVSKILDVPNSDRIDAEYTQHNKIAGPMLMGLSRLLVQASRGAQTRVARNDMNLNC